MDIDDECQCGEPPFTDGKICDACLELYGDELNRLVESGSITPLQAMVSLLWQARLDPDEYDED